MINKKRNGDTKKKKKMITMQDFVLYRKQNNHIAYKPAERNDEKMII